jgi:RNA polymerase sigma-70 factor, ECF subfamily
LSESPLASTIARFRPVLLTLAESLIARAYRTEVEASDLVQQTLMEAHGAASVLSTMNEAAQFAWLRNTLRHNLLDAVKHLRTLKQGIQQRHRFADLENSFIRLEKILIADETSPSQIVQRNEQVTLMLAAMQELPLQQRTAIILKHLQGLTLREVAESMNLSESATAGLLHRGRQQLAGGMKGRTHD